MNEHPTQIAYFAVAIFVFLFRFYCTKLTCSEEIHKGKLTIPDTKVGEEGSSKRNIQRKNDHDPHRKSKPQHGGAGGKGKWNDVDDGTFDDE
jgi:hypothetical protein